jgi:hypothetical protein
LVIHDALHLWQLSQIAQYCREYETLAVWSYAVNGGRDERRDIGYPTLTFRNAKIDKRHVGVTAPLRVLGIDIITDHVAGHGTDS